jgi:hypothetical protein
MAKDKEKDDDAPDQPEIVIVTDDPKNLDAQQGPLTDDGDLPEKPKSKEKPKDEGDDQDEPEDEPEESRLGESEELEAEAEAKDKAKAQHKSRRQRQKEAERRLRTERDFLEKRNEAVEKELMTLKKRMDSTDKSTLEGRINHTKTQIARAERIHADAIAAQKGDEATEALKIRDNLRESLRRDEERYVSLEKEERDPPARAEAPRPEVIKNARDWMGRTKWYDPQLRDQDSKIVRALDIAVEEDGFDPGTSDYFEELDRRIAKYLPHRSKKAKKREAEHDDEDVEDLDDEEERPQRRTAKTNGNVQRPSGGPRFRTGGPGRQLKDNEVFLSPDRIAAMKEVGAWDDPVLRQKYLKKYQQWDIDHAGELDR